MIYGVIRWALGVLIILIAGAAVAHEKLTQEKPAEAISVPTSDL